MFQVTMTFPHGVVEVDFLDNETDVDELVAAYPEATSVVLAASVIRTCR